MMGGFTHGTEMPLPSTPAGYHLARKSATISHTTTSQMSPSLDPKSHKHYHSQSRTSHPDQTLEHTTSSNGNASPTWSTDSHSRPHSRNHRLSNIVYSIPNPIKKTSNSIEDHVAEFRYQHNARAARREASRSSQHEHSGHLWSTSADLPRSGFSMTPQYEEVVEDWKERDEQAWAEELRKREQARRRTVNQSGSQSEWWTSEQATKNLPEEGL